MGFKKLLGALILFVTAAPALAEPMVGASVGNADTLISEGSKLFNQKNYKKAAESFYKATRANPTTLQTYLQLARADMLAKEIPQACYAYRVYLKPTPDSPERKKAAAENDQCERQLKSVKGAPDNVQKYVETKAAFFAALEANSIKAASDSLRTLVKDGFMGPELADMASKLGAAAIAAADAVHKRAVANEPLSSEVLRSARPLYQTATDVGASPADTAARIAYLDGLGALSDKEYKKAETFFTEASKGDPSNKEYVFSRGAALYQAGDAQGAIKLLDAELKDDPRTAVLRSSMALGHAADNGASDLEKLLFTTRFTPEK